MAYITYEMLQSKIRALKILVEDKDLMLTFTTEAVYAELLNQQIKEVKEFEQGYAKYAAFREVASKNDI